MNVFDTQKPLFETDERAAPSINIGWNQDAVIVGLMFDRGYLPFFLAWIESLKETSKIDVSLQVLALDDTVAEVAKNYADVRIHKPDVMGWEFTGGDYKKWVWSLEPKWARTLCSIATTRMRHPLAIACDVDTAFFNNGLDGIVADFLAANANAGLTPHYFPPQYAEREKSVGRYNYGLAAFRPFDDVVSAVDRWCDATEESCDPLKAGAQPHLDEIFAELGDKLHEFNKGVNCGPWQLPVIKGVANPSFMDGMPLRMFHYHECRRGIGRWTTKIRGDEWNCSNYDINVNTMDSVYISQIARLADAIGKLDADGVIWRT